MGAGKVYQPPRDDRLVSVGVTVDLELSEAAGGHVKCWQRLAEAAADAECGIDLTVYFLGAERRTMALGENVRYRLVPAWRGTRALGLSGVPAHTDLARCNPAALAMLAIHDVLHATGPFALSGTALRTAARERKPFACSVHTDNPAFTRHYMPNVLSALFGDSATLHSLMRWLRLPELGARRMARRVERGLAVAHHLFHGNCDQRRSFERAYPETPCSRLRRGIDHRRFHPGLRDRARLAARFGIPPSRPVLAFAGRIDGSKNVDLVAAISERLRSWEVEHSLLMLGEGTLRAPLQRALGAHARLPGGVPQPDLAWMLASADAFVFPSETDTVGNVALEAKACGLPLFVMAGTAPAEAVRYIGEDGIVIAGHDPSVWARTLAPILTDPVRLGRHRGSARRAGALLPSWREVLEEDLVPVWLRLAGRAAKPMERAPAQAAE